jgi:hypothetical protein
MSHEATWHDLDSSELKDRLRKLRGRFDELRRRL